MPHEKLATSHEQSSIPREEPAIPHEQPRIPRAEPVISREEPAGELFDDSASTELPRRPRRRLLTPIPLLLTGVLLVACGFIGGVVVQKGEGSSGAPAPSSGLSSRFAALRSPAGGSAGVSRGAIGAGGAFAGAGASGRAGTTIGQVAFVAGNTLYVTDPEGSTVKVNASQAATITKTVKADVRQIHPGETVIVTGRAGAKGAIGAESIRVSEAGNDALGALLGGGGGLRGTGFAGAARPEDTGGGKGAGGSSEGPVLFGK